MDVLSQNGLTLKNCTTLELRPAAVKGIWEISGGTNKDDIYPLGEYPKEQAEKVFNRIMAHKERLSRLAFTQRSVSQIIFHMPQRGDDE
jgi:hypothetical protein